MKAIGYFRVASDVEQDVPYTLKEQERIFSNSAARMAMRR